MKELLAWLKKEYEKESEIIQQHEEYAKDNGLPIPAGLTYVKVKRNAYFRVIQKINTMERNQK